MKMSEMNPNMASLLLPFALQLFGYGSMMTKMQSGQPQIRTIENIALSKVIKYLCFNNEKNLPP